MVERPRAIEAKFMGGDVIEVSGVVDDIRYITTVSRDALFDLESSGTEAEQQAARRDYIIDAILDAAENGTDPPADVSGSAVSIADGGSVTLGSKADAAATTDTGSQTQMSLFKRMQQKFTTLLSVLPGALTGSGNFKTAVEEALPAGDNNIGNVDIVTLPTLPAGTNNIGDVDVLTLPSIGQLPSSLGQKTKANSTSMVLASDQDALPITDNNGSVTIDSAQLPSALGQTTKANSLPVTLASNQDALPITDNNSSVTVDSSQLPATLGQTTKANSLPVTLASNQDALPITDNSGSLTIDTTQLPSSLGQKTSANSLSFVQASDAVSKILAALAQAPASYRSALTAADVISVPTLGTITAVGSGTSLANTAYNVRVGAVNAFGRTTVVTPTGSPITPTAGQAVRIPITQVTGATHYDIYLSTDSSPKFVGRITESQRASGIVLSGVNTTSAGGTAGAVDVNVVGTGSTAPNENTAFVIPAEYVDTSNYQYVDFDLTFSRTGNMDTPACTVVPAFYNSRQGLYFLGAPQTIILAGAVGVFYGNQQRIRIETRGCPRVALLIASLSGTSVSLNMDAIPS